MIDQFGLSLFIGYKVREFEFGILEFEFADSLSNVLKLFQLLFVSAQDAHSGTVFGYYDELFSI